MTLILSEGTILIKEHKGKINELKKINTIGRSWHHSYRSDGNPNSCAANHRHTGDFQAEPHPRSPGLDLELDLPPTS